MTTTSLSIVDSYIGFTSCDDCKTRFRVKSEYQNQIGKPVRCPKCKNVFVMELVEPTPLEAVSIQAANTEEESENKSNPKTIKRRTKAEIRQEAIDSIRDGFRRRHPRLVEISNSPRASEEEVRRWCIEALENVLGYSKNELDTEVRTLGGKVDIALKRGDHIFLVIECKNIRAKLNNNVRDQAAGYATSLSAEWAVVTNGQIWRLYRVIPQAGRDPRFIEIFDVSLLDEDGVSEVDAENLYLLTSKAVFGGDLENMSHLVACTSKKRILQALASERVVKALRLELATTYKDEQDKNVSLDDGVVESALQNALGLGDL
ncbi:type I restriction enzyme HsdR N-terminal domain-containing protein [Nodosilinea sp. LEGE 07298]|uniref:type I restriction enzyme HsdR N-terminal domain-containing protein n=1 Tax=Nodosilinea sp. LEGE 07298 TaxID=2777970 RepID=UPI00188212ED|nr:type I restriction enzyme HsdR N-terminal domain-containing protein [Nodosilinea sp. LEGE 07298]MBE9111798.1 type I restriction enzyme HsdR N-terminal domain-containing protein [Nodosilinea sp. LEGE 07298]